MRSNVIAGFMLCLLASGAAAAEPPKPTAAIYVEGTSEKLAALGQQLAISLSSRLTGSGHFSIVDRAHIRAILGEQRMAAAGQVTPATEFQIGRMLGVTYLIIVRVNTFTVNYEQRTSGLSLLTKQQYYVAHVNLGDHIQIIEATSGRVVQSIDDTQQADSGLLQASTAQANGHAFAIEQTEKLITASADVISGKLDAIKFSESSPQQQVSGKILSLDGDQIVTTLSATDGVSVGQMIGFYDTRSLLNPDTGKTIITYIKRGTIQLIQVEKDYSVAKLINGSPAKLQVLRPE